MTDESDMLPPSKLLLETKKPLVVYFRKEWDTLIDSNTTKDAQSLPEFDLIFIATWDELYHAIRLRPNHIIFHADIVSESGHTVAQIIGMVRTSIELLAPGTTVQLSIGIDKTTTQFEITEFKQTSLNGIVPSISSFGFNESLTAVLVLLSGLPYWPLDIINSLPIGHKPKLVSGSSTNDISLTPRQQEVASLLKNRGISNKHIARQLHISESTVKLHLSAILKKYNLRNRTQLAVTLANTKVQID